MEYEVSGIFDVGFYDFNSTVVVVSLPNAQDMSSLGDNVHGLMAMLNDPFAAGNVRDQLKSALGPAIQSLANHRMENKIARRGRRGKERNVHHPALRHDRRGAVHPERVDNFCGPKNPRNRNAQGLWARRIFRWADCSSARAHSLPSLACLWGWVHRVSRAEISQRVFIFNAAHDRNGIIPADIYQSQLNYPR